VTHTVFLTLVFVSSGIHAMNACSTPCGN